MSMGKTTDETRTRKTLSTKQLEAIQILMDNPDLPYEAVSQMVGVGRKTLYNWRHNELFKAELDRRIKERWKDSERLAIETMLNLCRAGNYKAAEYILDSLGYNSVQKVEVQGNIPLVISNDLDE